jgi:hypothetical protein
VAVIFMDSFDYFSLLTDRYQTVEPDAALVGGGLQRTGTQCYVCNSGNGAIAKTVKRSSDMLIAAMTKRGNPGNLLGLGNDGGGDLLFGTCLFVHVNGDGSLQALTGPARGFTNLGPPTAPNLYQFNTYNSVAMRGLYGAAGRIRLYCNGVLVLDLNPIDTTGGQNPGGGFFDTVSFVGTTGGAGFFDDVYALDCTVPPNDGYLGAVRIYAQVPVADGAVSWTPSTGMPPNYQQVNEIPPDQNTIFNSSSTVGQSDQYVYPLPGIPPNSTIFCVQHCQDFQVSNGSRVVTSDIGGFENAAGIALASSYAIYAWQYDVNPVTGLAWTAADFPVLAGPAVIA